MAGSFVLAGWALRTRRSASLHRKEKCKTSCFCILEGHAPSSRSQKSQNKTLGWNGKIGNLGIVWWEWLSDCSSRMLNAKKVNWLCSVIARDRTVAATFQDLDPLSHPTPLAQGQIGPGVRPGGAGAHGGLGIDPVRYGLRSDGVCRSRHWTEFAG